MNIVLLGGLGTIGQPLATALRSIGHMVTVVDQRHSGGCVRADIAEMGQLHRAVPPDTDMVFNLAAEFGRMNGEGYPEQLWRSNAIGMKNVLRLQRERRFRLVHFSSSEIYGEMGDTSDGLLVESITDECPVLPANDYAISKWVNELQIDNETARHGTHTMVVRLFNAYGPGEHYHPYRSVVCLFCHRLTHGLPITVYEGYRRAFMYIDDLVATLAKIPEKFMAGLTVNIGGSEVRDVLDVVSVIEKHVSFDPRLVTLLPQEQHNVRNKAPDLAVAKNMLGHSPSVTLEQGIPLTLKWMAGIGGQP